MNSFNVHAQFPSRIIILSTKLARIVSNVLMNSFGMINELTVILKLLAAWTDISLGSFYSLPDDFGAALKFCFNFYFSHFENMRLHVIFNI